MDSQFWGRKELLKKSKSTCNFGLIKEDDISDLVKSVEDHLGLESDSTVHENITEESMRTASEMLTYLSFCPPEAEMDAKRKELDLSLKVYSPKEVLIILNRLLRANRTNLPYRDAFSRFLEKLRKAWNLQYKEIQALMTGNNCEDCRLSQKLIDNPKLAAIANHPVHIVNEEGNTSPSSFIPFCWFGDNKSISIKNEKFNVPVCNSFKPKLRNDQVCYEMDPNKLLNGGQTANKIALFLLFDENKDRQLKSSMDRTRNETFEDKENFMPNFRDQKETTIFLDTIGKNCHNLSPY